MYTRTTMGQNIGPEQLRLRAEIRRLRLARGLGAIALARQLGWQRAAVINIEQGLRYLSLPELHQLAQAIAPDPEALMRSAVPAVILV